MSTPTIPLTAFSFLNQLKRNNNREWFSKHKEAFITEQTYIHNFAEALLHELNKHDVIETPSGKKACYRIYRDVRFSKDKTPYCTYFSGSFRRATKYRRGGLYFHLEPGNTWMAGGFWSPNTEDLKRIRDDIAFDATPLRKILKSKTFVSSFGTLKGEQLKKAPKGFDANHEAIDLLRYKQFLLIKKFTDKEVLSDDFIKLANQTFKNMRPFLDYMSEVLTTDINGLEI
jgi:uncharacterized protein (TIGR02453 family)